MEEGAEGRSRHGRKSRLLNVVKKYCTGEIRCLNRSMQLRYWLYNQYSTFGGVVGVIIKIIYLEGEGWTVLVLMYLRHPENIFFPLDQGVTCPSTFHCLHPYCCACITRQPVLKLLLVHWTSYIVVSGWRSRESVITISQRFECLLLFIWPLHSEWRSRPHSILTVLR